MESEISPPRARQFIEELVSKGRYLFESAEAQAALGISMPAVNAALHRLAKQGAIASPARGYYVIVPPEYRSLRCLPADQFVPSLMKGLALPYYVGLLTAAQYHGAAHQRPQEFQVFLDRNRRRLDCGKVRVRFIVRKRLRDVPTQTTVASSSSRAAEHRLYPAGNRRQPIGLFGRELLARLGLDLVPEIAEQLAGDC
jgi:predicted transcriptional regulator of viral defense system